MSKKVSDLDVLENEIDVFERRIERRIYRIEQSQDRCYGLRQQLKSVSDRIEAIEAQCSELYRALARMDALLDRLERRER